MKLIDFGIAGSEGIAAADVRARLFQSHGHAGLHLAGAGEIETRGRAERHLCSRRHAVRDAHRRRALSWADAFFAIMNRPAAEQSRASARIKSGDILRSCRRLFTGRWSAIPQTDTPALRANSRTTFRNPSQVGVAERPELRATNQPGGKRVWHAGQSCDGRTWRWR